jgi:arsenate reductase (glutaredoxin)
MSDEPVTLYHNPRCSKSRAALVLLVERGMTPVVVEYLKTPLGAAELAALLAKLRLPAEALVRKGEPTYRERYAARVLDDAGWIEALVAHPILMERPVVVRGARAVVARPPEKLLEIL